VETVDSSSHLSDPVIGSHPEPHENQILGLIYNLASSFFLRLRIPSGVFLSDFPTRMFYAFVAFASSFSLILSFYK
jgi:hypothetical protein